MADSVFHIKVVSFCDKSREALLGAVAPDIFYYYDYKNPAHKKGSLIGDLIHQEKHTELLEHFYYYLTSTKNKFLFSFFTGLVSHLITDSLIHHYIIARTGRYPRTELRHWDHKILEMQIDKEILLKYGGSFRFYHAKIDVPEARIVKIYSEAMEDVYNIRDYSMYDMIIQSYKDTKNLLRFFYDPLKIKRKLLKPLTNLIKMPMSYVFYPPSKYYIDPMNESKKIYRNKIYNEYTDANVFEIFETARLLTCMYRDILFKYIFKFRFSFKKLLSLKIMNIINPELGINFNKAKSFLNVLKNSMEVK